MEKDGYIMIVQQNNILMISFLNPAGEDKSIRIINSTLYFHVKNPRMQGLSFEKLTIKILKFKFALSANNAE